MLTLRQVLGTLLIVSAILWVISTVGKDEAQAPTLLPNIEPAPLPVIETKPMYNYGQEGQKLNSIMAKHGVGFQVARFQRAPFDVTYTLRRGKDAKTGKGVPVSMLVKALGDIRADLYRYRKGLGVDVDPGLAIDELNCTLTARRVDPEIMAWADRPQDLPEFHLMLGLSDGQPALMNLDDPTTCHLLIGGTTGSGKSNLIAGMLLSGAESNVPARLRIVIIDIGGKRYDAFKALPHCERYITDLDEALAYLKKVESALNGPEGAWQYRTVIMIDEIQKMTRTADKLAQREFHRVLKQITGLARGYGYNLIAATQKPYATVVPAEMRDNFPARCAGRCQSRSQSSMILGEDEYAAASLVGVGTFILNTDRKTTVNAFLITDEAQAVAAIADQWGHVAPKTAIAPLLDNELDEFGFIDLPQPLLEVLKEYDDGAGSLRYGWKTKGMQAVAQAMGIPYKGNNYKAIEREMSKYIELYRSGEY
jgi:hypothetical protein